MLGIALTLVVLVSTITLLYQFWAQSLVDEDAGSAATPTPLEDAPVRGLHADAA